MIRRLTAEDAGLGPVDIVTLLMLTKVVQQQQTAMSQQRTTIDPQQVAIDPPQAAVEQRQARIADLAGRILERRQSQQHR